jgi:ferritin-like metal-binding protein YciE
MEAIKDLRGLLRHHILNLYSAEDQMINSLPSLIRKASHSSLKNALKHHLAVTRQQKKRLEQVAQLLDEKAGSRGKKRVPSTGANAAPGKQYACKGMAGLIEEANELMIQRMNKDVIDAAIITCVQKMEHYEICTYGTALAYAEQLHIPKVEALLEETLNEEYDADDLLTSLAISAMNKEAEHESGGGPVNSLQDAVAVGIKVPRNIEHMTERSIHSPGGRSGTSHRRYANGESRGH